ncbi:MAG: hypothetical protein ABIS47_05305 [Acidimicrobiales bacterium]
MAKAKATITVDREKLAAARAVLGASSASATIDVALSEVVRRAQIRRDVEAYRGVPPTEDGAGLSQVGPDWDDLADDTDWEAEWPSP